MKLNIALETSPLGNAHAGRGIGMYTRMLMSSLQAHPEVALYQITAKRKMVINPDVVQYPFFDLFFASLPLTARWPRVVTIHDVIPLQFPKFYPAGIKGRFNLLRQKAALRNVELVVTDSWASQQNITIHLGVPEEKVRVVYLAAHPDIKAVKEEIVVQELKKLKIPKQYILYVGDINYNKNLPQLIKALKFLPDDIHLVCVGSQFYPHDIPEWRWIETQLALSNVTDRVHFLTEVSSLTTLSALYTQALVYVQPSLAEGFGLPVLEAMQCGTPVVAARTSSLVEVGGNQALFASPEAEPLAEQINQVLEWSMTKRREVGKAHQDWAASFSWEKVADNMVTIYKELC